MCKFDSEFKSNKSDCVIKGRSVIVDAIKGHYSHENNSY
jgi:hypothetical protein